MSEEERKITVFEALSGTGRRVKRWEKAGVITSGQLFAILDFERERQGKRMMRGMMALAVFAIGLGVLSIVAANWLYIPGGAKIGLHFLLNIIVAVAVWKSAARGDTVWREGAVMLFAALNLTFIVLVGQVFQLSGNYAVALSLWLFISSPAVFLYGRSVANAVFWCASFLLTFHFVLVEVFYHVSDYASFMIGLAVALFLPLGFMAAGLSGKFQSLRSAWSITAFRTGTIFLVTAATLSSFSWYGSMVRELTDVLSLAGSYTMGYTSMLLLCLSAPVSVIIYTALATKDDYKKSIGALFVIGSLVSMIVPLVLVPPELPVFTAVHFITYWGFLGWVGHKLGYEQLVSQSITLITLRLIVVYFELFGGLMLTGFGLIFSGVFMLYMLKFANKLKKKIGGMA